MSSSKIIELEKKSKKQKNYDWFCNNAEKILKPHNIDYDIIEIELYGQGLFGLKIFVADSGTYLFECDKQGYKKFLRETRDNILKNPFKCPFCGELEPDDKCSKCGAIFTNNHDYFFEALQRATFINSKCFKLFNDFKGNIKDIVEGVNIIYVKDSSYPTYCLSNKVIFKNIDSIDRSSLNQFLVAFLVSNNDKYEKYSFTENYWEDEECVAYFKDGATDLSVIVFFEVEVYGENTFDTILKVGVGESLQDFIKAFFPEKNINVENWEDEDGAPLDYLDIFDDEMYSFDYMHDYKNHDEWWCFKPDDFDYSKCNSLAEMAEQLEKNIANYLEDFFKNTKKAVENTIKIIEG